MPQATDSNLPINRHTPIKRHTDTFHRLPTAISQAPDLWVCVGCFAYWSVACGMCRSVFYGCVAVAWVVASWVGGCKENLDDIRAKPFQAIHKHILARKPHTCLLEIQDVPQSRNGSMGSMICSPLFSLSFSGLLWSSLGLSGPLWASLCLSGLLWPISQATDTHR